MRNPKALFLDFSNTITTVESENEALARYLDFIRRTYALQEDLWNSFTTLRLRRLTERESNFRTFMDINKGVLRELYGITEMFPEEYYRFHETHLKLRNDFPAFIEEVKPEFSIVMVTDADNIYTYRTLSALMIRQFFDGIVTAENVRASKPDSRMFEAALREADEPDTVIFIGDSERRDIEGSKRMGFTAVRMDDDSNSTIADMTVHNFTEALNFLKKRNLL